MSAYIGKVKQIASYCSNGILSAPHWLKLDVEYPSPYVDSINLAIAGRFFGFNSLFSILTLSLTSGASVLVFTRKGRIPYFKIKEIIIWGIIVSPLVSDREREEQFNALIEKYGSKFNY